MSTQFSRRTAQLLTAAVLGLGVAATGCADQAAATELPHVLLSESSPEAIHNPDGSWSIPIRPRGTQAALAQPVGACRGTYINPEIVARGNGTAVHFGTKYFCTSPVSYSITTGVDNFYEDAQGGPVVRTPADRPVAAVSRRTPTSKASPRPARTTSTAAGNPTTTRRSTTARTPAEGTG